MRSKLKTSQISGTVSIEDKIQKRIDKIRKAYRLKIGGLIILITTFILFDMLPTNDKNNENTKVLWYSLSSTHKKVILPVLSFVDESETSFPLEVDLYSGEMKLPTIKKAKLHGLEIDKTSLDGSYRARLEIPKDQISKLPLHSSLKIKLYPHLESRHQSRLKRRSYEVIF
ncbi:MAG: hypothetical protein KC493_06380 [Bacteriovoracaceae bacterium]|nr:hypothetical protein [Bacteriovoracaceae bacterium]